MSESEMQKTPPPMTIQELIDEYRDAARKERTEKMRKDACLLAIINQLAGADDAAKIIKVCENLMI